MVEGRLLVAPQVLLVALLLEVLVPQALLLEALLEALLVVRRWTN